MKRSKFTDSQIMEALKRVDAGLAVPDICRELAISTATFYKWRSKYGGMDTSMKFKPLLPNGCINTIMNVQIWHWTVLPRNSDWPWLLN